MRKLKELTILFAILLIIAFLSDFSIGGYSRTSIDYLARKVQSIKTYVDYKLSIDVNEIYTEIEGPNNYAFKTITGITNDVVADSSTDTLTLSSANARLTIAGTTTTDTITFTADTDLHNYSWTSVDGTDLKTGSVTQAYDIGLTDLAGIGMAADKYYYTSGDNTHVAGTITSFGRSIIDDANEAVFKATVNLEIGTDVQAYDADLDDLADGSLTASKVAGVADTDYGDVTVSGGSWTVEDNSHAHVYSNIDETTSANWKGRVSDEIGNAGYWVFVNDASPAKNDMILYNGTDFVCDPEGTSYTFTIATFVDNQTNTQEIGTGTWKAIGAISFTASYNNAGTGPDDTPYVSKSTTGGTNTWSSNLDMTTSPAFEGPTITDEIVTHRTSAGSIVFTLYAAEGAENDTDTETVYFYNRRHWGVTSETSGWDSSDIGNLANNELSNSETKTFALTTGSGEYMLYAYPLRLGTASFTVGGFEGGFESPATVSRTNDSGFVENYYVYRSSNANLGTVTVVVTGD